MKRFILLSITFFFLLANPNQIKAQASSKQYIITKEKGQIIKAYEAFKDFLNSDRSWTSYERMILEAYPEMQAVHNTSLRWKSIDSLTFPNQLKTYKAEDWERYFNQYNDSTLNVLYDSIIEKANTILCPIKKNKVDLCLFLPYAGCFIIPGEIKSTIYISLLINPNEVQKIMTHEYAHNLHKQRCPEEPLTLKREMVSEGIAVYLTTMINKNMGLSNAIPFMPESSVKWCFENEQMIRDSIIADLNDTTELFLKKYIADGSCCSAPPKGFVEKTAYFTGYRIIEACIKKGMKLEDICSLNSDAVIEKSGYFKKD
jgi:uncharacterized protein YjaZ